MVKKLSKAQRKAEKSRARVAEFNAKRSEAKKEAHIAEEAAQEGMHRNGHYGP